MKLKNSFCCILNSVISTKNYVSALQIKSDQIEYFISKALNNVYTVIILGYILRYYAFLKLGFFVVRPLGRKIFKYFFIRNIKERYNALMATGRMKVVFFS
jgi:hypothetical protein